MPTGGPNVMQVASTTMIIQFSMGAALPLALPAHRPGDAGRGVPFEQCAHVIERGFDRALCARAPRWPCQLLIASFTSAQPADPPRDTRRNGGPAGLRGK
eukprot:9279822-Pyramimonas_sp.AAC.1